MNNGKKYSERLVMIGIYKITNLINGKVYIGQSINIEQRIRQHKCVSQKENKSAYFALYRAIKKYGFDNFNFEVIEECSKEKLDEREIYWISHYHSTVNENGYNMTFGGTNAVNKFYRTVVQMDSITGEELNKYPTLSEASRAVNGSVNSIRGCCLGKFKTSYGYAWKYEDDDTYVFVPKSYTYKRKVKQIDRKTKEVIAVYDSAMEAAQAQNRPNGESTICSVCLKRKPSAYGYLWEYVS